MRRICAYRQLPLLLGSHYQLDMEDLYNQYTPTLPLCTITNGHYMDEKTVYLTTQEGRLLQSENGGRRFAMTQLPFQSPLPGE